MGASGRPIKDWEELKGLIRRRFRSSRVTAEWQFSAVSQVKTPSKYRSSVRPEVTTPLDDGREEVLLGFRKNGI